MSMDVKIPKVFILFGIHQASGIFKFLPLTKFRDFSVTIFSNIMFCTAFLLLSFWDYDEMNIEPFGLSQPKAFFMFSIFFFFATQIGQFLLICP